MRQVNTEIILPNPCARRRLLRRGAQALCLALGWLLIVVMILLPQHTLQATELRGADRAESVLQAGLIVTVPYTSSVDGAALLYWEYLPANYNPSLAYPLVILLPSAYGNVTQYFISNPAWLTAADNHAYVLATVQPRTMPGYGTSRETFYLNGPLAPGEQDVLDVLPSITARQRIDLTRLYLAGYSMGGIGSLNIATQHPGLFAAAASAVAVSDFFQEAIYTPTAAYPTFAILLGGLFGQTALTDTFWYQNSPRFLLPNLMNTPVYFVHGVNDTLVPNATNVWPYMQSRHIVDVPGYTDARGRAITLQELRAQWPGTYEEQHLWPPAGHNNVMSYWTPENVLTFFDAHPLVTNPLTVALTTYDDWHTRAYWLQLDLVHPWTATPGLVYAVRNPSANSVQVQISGSVTVTLSMRPMGLVNSAPLTVVVSPIGSAGPTGHAALILSGTWNILSTWAVTSDGIALPPLSYTLTISRWVLLRQPIDVTHTYTIAALPIEYPNQIYLPLILK